MPTTTNHAVNLPTNGADFDQWGTENNDAHQAWDTLTSGAQNTVLGRVAASSGPYTQLTATQLTTIPNAVVGDAGAGGTKGLVPAPSAGDAAARKFLMADGTWVADERKAWATVTGTTGAIVVGRNLSCTRVGPGDYDFTFTTALASADYAVFVTDGSGAVLILRVDGASRTTTGFTVLSDTTAISPIDPAEFYVQVIAA